MVDSDGEKRDRSRRGERGSRFDNDDRDKSRNRDRDRQECRRIYISNIPYEYRWQDLKDLFRREVGDVSFVELFQDENSKPRGCGIVEFDKSELVAKALEKMNRYDLNGRNLVIKEDYGNERDKYGRVIPKSGGGGGGLGGGLGNSGGGGGRNNNDNYRRDRDDDRMLVITKFAFCPHFCFPFFYNLIIFFFFSYIFCLQKFKIHLKQMFF